MSRKINAQIIADSVNIQGNRITTYILTYPRMIHAEVMTHRMFSRNAASSRAIPFEKMLKMVEEDPFIPIAWQKDHKGMQGTEYITDSQAIESKKRDWITASKWAIRQAEKLNYDEWGKGGVTKQLCNRLLEPFMWYTCLVTATEYDNFFELRAPKYYSEDTKKTYKSKKDYIEDHKLDFSPYNNIQWLEVSKSGAEIHIQALAEAMWDARNESTPKLLNPGDWHIPFGDQMDDQLLSQLLTEKYPNWYDHSLSFTENIQREKSKIAVARCARLSYMTFEGEINYQKDIELHDTLLRSGHMSPFEHCARAMTDKEYRMFLKGKAASENYQSDNGGWGSSPYITYSIDNHIQGWCNNLRGFVQYRYLVENKQ